MAQVCDVALEWLDPAHRPDGDLLLHTALFVLWLASGQARRMPKTI